MEEKARRVLQLSRKPGAVCLQILVIKPQSQMHLLCCVCFANQALLCITLRFSEPWGSAQFPKQRLPVSPGTPHRVPWPPVTKPPGLCSTTLLRDMQKFPPVCMPSVPMEPASIPTAPHTPVEQLCHSWTPAYKDFNFNYINCGNSHHCRRTELSPAWQTNSGDLGAVLASDEGGFLVHPHS